MKTGTPAALTRLRVVAALVVLPAVSFGSSASGQADNYHILLANDDGIESPGIQTLAEALRGVGEVSIVAPCGQRSGSSMSVALGDQLALREVERDGVVLGHCVDTTPAGTVLLALTMLAPEGGFDVVVSGLNRGANVGWASHMSGTVGAAMMGALHGVPAVAASVGGGRDFDYPARFVASFIEEMRRHPAMPGVVFSINIPRTTEAETAGVVIAPMGGSHLRLGYEEVEPGDDGRRFRPQIGREESPPAGSDTASYLQDMITITPLLFDWTAREVVEQMQGWSLRHDIAR